MRRIVIVVALFGVVLGATGPARAASPEGPVYLALGDSQAFGVGTPREDKLGYVPFLSRWAHATDCRDGSPEACPLLELVNLSVPGATSATLIAGQLPAAIGLITDRRTDGDPGNDVVLITVTIGGNDLFNPVIANCSGGPTPTCVQTIQSLFTTYVANLGVILGSLRSVAGPDAEIIITTYDNPLGACHLAALEPLADVVLEGGAGIAVGFNDLIKAVAAATAVEVADTFGQLDPQDWVGGTDCLHPDISGYQKIASIIRDVIDE
ncbi:MAG TPA: SGNH/GDSL hydrolase family protein [Acidimicrobiia bacterium]|nr:SGNH/GDSL hydrolase family protein [Acidimicrobiia bacterium]